MVPDRKAFAIEDACALEASCGNKLTARQASVLEAIYRTSVPIPATRVALRLDLDRRSGGAAVMPALKVLLAKGLIVRIDGDNRRAVTYQRRFVQMPPIELVRRGRSTLCGITPAVTKILRRLLPD